MCRCCQSCLEELYWNCIEEKFCYDESIASYNPDEDESISKKNGCLIPPQQYDNNNMPIINQQPPLNRHCSTLSSKIHEEDYRREIQTSVPILAPEILAVFSNSQIFHDHQPKSSRSTTKSYLPSIHGKDKETDQEKLIKRLEGSTENESNKKIKFTITSDSSEDLKRSLSPKKFTAIIEEDSDKDEIILRPKNIHENNSNNYLNVDEKQLRNVQSVPYFSFRPASENNIFAISNSLSQISMTPEIPSISYSNLPKNYLDTPTIEKYRESKSLYSIQTANQANAIEKDLSMPRYFRMSGLIAQSAENVQTIMDTTPKRPEKSKRLKGLRDNLPPLLIHSARHRFKDDSKHAD